MQSSQVHIVRYALAALAAIGGPESETVCLATMRKSDNPLVVAYGQMALAAMWGKGSMLFSQAEVRRMLKWAEKTNRLVMLDSWDTRQLKGDDPLATGFLQTVESLFDAVLTYQRKVAAIQPG